MRVCSVGCCRHSLFSAQGLGRPLARCSVGTLVQVWGLRQQLLVLLALLSACKVHPSNQRYKRRKLPLSYSGSERGEKKLQRMFASGPF